MNIRLFRPREAPPWFNFFLQSTERELARVTNLESYVVADLPSAALPPRLIYVSDETGGAVVAFNDGTNWRRVTDRAIVS